MGFNAELNPTAGSDARRGFSFFAPQRPDRVRIAQASAREDRAPAGGTRSRHLARGRDGMSLAKTLVKFVPAGAFCIRASSPQAPEHFLLEYAQAVLGLKEVAVRRCASTWCVVPAEQRWRLFGSGWIDRVDPGSVIPAYHVSRGIGDRGR